MISHPAAFAPNCCLCWCNSACRLVNIGRLLADLPLAYLTWFARRLAGRRANCQCPALAYEIKHNGLSEVLAPLRKRPR